MKIYKIIPAVLTALVLLSGCGSFSEHLPDDFPDSPPEEERIGEEEVLKLMREMYGDHVRFLREEGSCLMFSQSLDDPAKGTFSFLAKQEDGSARLQDNYYDELYRYTGNAYFEQSGREAVWEEEGEGIYKRYTPVFSVYGRNDSQFRRFCSDVCDYVEFCRAVAPFGNRPRFLAHFLISYRGNQRDFQPSEVISNYDRTEFFNELYAFADEFLLSGQQMDAVEDDEELYDELASLGQDLIKYYLEIEPACVFVAQDGMEYRMIETDRATGSSYYSLLGTYDQGKTCAFFNRDPYNGSGGASKWLSFIDAEIGFSCLAYSGGSYGSLYRTEDGGKSFQEIEYPSPKAVLPDGEFYNPFVMPDQVFEEDGRLFLIAGQGPDGDYYSEENGHCSGLYVSDDLGKTWEYVGETAEQGEKSLK